MSVLVVGCYDSGNREDCVGMSCAAGMQWPDGGEVRIQYVSYPDGIEWRGITGFFIDEQTPETIYTGLVLNACAPDVGFGAQSRTFHDVGESITVNMGDMSITAPRVTGDDATDFLYRQLDVGYITQTYEPTSPEFFNAFHSVELIDSDGFSRGLSTLYMPPELDIVNPVAEGAFVNIKRGEDLEVVWSQTEQPPFGITTMAVILFVDPSLNTGPPMTCIAFNTGHLTIPKEVVDRLPPAGILQAGTVANEATLNDEDRRVDLWGTNCDAVPYTLID